MSLHRLCLTRSGASLHWKTGVLAWQSVQTCSKSRVGELGKTCVSMLWLACLCDWHHWSCGSGEYPKLLSEVLHGAVCRQKLASLLDKQDRCTRQRMLPCLESRTVTPAMRGAGKGDCWHAASREPTKDGSFRPLAGPLQACQAMEHLLYTLEAPGLPAQSTLLRRTLDVAGSDARTLFDVVQAGAGYCGPNIYLQSIGALCHHSQCPTYSGSTIGLPVWLRKGCQAPDRQQQGSSRARRQPARNQLLALMVPVTEQAASEVACTVVCIPSRSDALFGEMRVLFAQVVEAAVQHLELSAAAPSGPASPTHRGRAGPSRLSQVGPSPEADGAINAGCTCSH